MTTQAIELKGELRTPINNAAQAKGSIHDDATASKLGFKGGTVAGSVHMDQYMPLMLQMFGEDWWRHGNISLYFRQATVDRENVRAFASRAAGADHGRAWMENENGDLISEGTVSCAGHDEKTELTQRVAGQTPAVGLRILSAASVGKKVEGVAARASKDGIERRMATITENLPIYREKNVLPPSIAVQTFRGVEAELFQRTGVVGLFGAIELQYINGPLLAETDYKARGEILALTESPKTENVWYKAYLSDAATGEDVASMIMYLRFLKASSPLYG